MSHDILSDLLRSVRLRGALFYYVNGSRNWAAEAPASRDISAAVMPDSEHVMEYHVVTRGSCWGAIVGEAHLAHRKVAAHATTKTAIQTAIDGGKAPNAPS